MSLPRPEFIRIPADGERCPHTGLGRTTMRRLCVPLKANGYKPKVPAKCLRETGNVQGIWLVPCAALLAHLHDLPTPGLVIEPAPKTTSAGRKATTDIEAGSAGRRITSRRLAGATA